MGICRQGRSDRGRRSGERGRRGEVGFIAMEGGTRFVGAKPGDVVLSSTVETNVLLYASTALLEGQSWSGGAKVHVA